MEFKQLESFVAVVKFNSFTKAAESLYISQPTISTHIRMLEEELNTRLILRTTKNTEITSKGRALYEYAQNMLELRDRMIQEFTTESRKIIHLGASTIPSAYILPEVLPVFGKDHPDTFFVIHQSDSQGVINGLNDSIFDVGLVGMECSSDTLVCQSFCRDRMILITPVTEKFLALQDQPETPLDILLQEPLILREKGSGSQKSADRFLTSMGIDESKLHVTARINDQEAIKNLVAGGLGISIISERAARNFLNAKRLLKFELPNCRQRELYLVYRREYTLKNYVREFADFVLQSGADA